MHVKPLKDWTLAEIQAECRKTSLCNQCQFWSGNSDDGCVVRRSIISEKHDPDSWELTESFRFSGREYSLMAALQSLFPEAESISLECALCETSVYVNIPGERIRRKCVIPESLFPSFQHTGEVNIKEELARRKT